jgi:hypothetical protein
MVTTYDHFRKPGQIWSWKCLASVLRQHFPLVPEGRPLLLSFPCRHLPPLLLWLVRDNCVNLMGAYLAISRINLSERASIIETCDILDGFTSVTAKLDGLDVSGLLSIAKDRWIARVIARILSFSSSRRFLALSLCDCARRRLDSALSSCRRLFGI